MMMTALSAALTLNAKSMFPAFCFQEPVALLSYDIQINYKCYKGKGAYKQFIYEAGNLNHDGLQQTTA